VESRVSYTAVGLFVIGLGAALILSFVWLATRGNDKTYLRYDVLTTESVAGLNQEAAVTYRGVVVGRVAAISIDPDDPEQVRIQLDIEAGTPVRTDTSAVLATRGITGLVRVELTGGSRAAPALVPVPGHPPPVIPSGPSLVARLDSALDMLVVTVERVSTRFDRLLSDDNLDAIAGTLDALRVVTGEIAGHRAEIGAGLAHAATTLENTTRLSGELASTLARTAGSVAALEETARSVTRTSRALETAVGEGRQGVAKAFGQLGPEVTALLGEMRQLAETLRRVARDVEANPRVFLFGRQRAEPGPGE
jgi:phospholipid/cholesterol/gamma-HCH transport system substrate-binding protein